MPIYTATGVPIQNPFFCLKNGSFDSSSVKRFYTKTDTLDIVEQKTAKALQNRHF
jgi:hypothetical protein